MIIYPYSTKVFDAITPFAPRSEAFGMTYGAGPAGYDVRVEFDSEGAIESVDMAPGSFMLASTIERFSMPGDVVGIVHDKSTWARRGLAVQNTVIEPGWRGFLTLELSNHGKQFLTLKRGMPIAQIIFHLVDQQSPYEGRYQDQERGPQLAR